MSCSSILLSSLVSLFALLFCQAAIENKQQQQSLVSDNRLILKVFEHSTAIIKFGNLLADFF